MRRVNAVVLIMLTGTLTLQACKEGGPTEPTTTVEGASVALNRGPVLSAVMDFGTMRVGSPFPPPSGHDASFHAKDKVRPGTVVIAAGGTVLFNVGPAHQVGVYDDGTTPADIDLSTAGMFIVDPTNRIGLDTEFSFDPTHLHQYSFTFDAPGRYLVICTFTPHFVNAKMYGWVIVK